MPLTHMQIWRQGDGEGLSRQLLITVGIWEGLSPTPEAHTRTSNITEETRRAPDAPPVGRIPPSSMAAFILRMRNQQHRAPKGK